MNKLLITPEDFKRGYDYNVAPYISQMGYGTKIFDYISWSNMYMLLKQLHPTLNVDYTTDAEGSCIYYLPNTLEAREDMRVKIDEIQARLNYVQQSDGDPPELSDDARKKLLRLFEHYKDLYYYNKRGSYVQVYIYDVTTGERSPNLLYPLMDSSNESITDPDSRDLNDNLMRAYVKCVATYTGLGLRLFTREGIDEDPLDPKNKKRSKLFQLLLEASKLQKYYLTNFSSTMPEYWPEQNPNFATPISIIEDLIDSLKEQIRG